MSFLGGYLPAGGLCRRKGRRGGVAAGRQRASRAERLRGIALSHRDWLMADGGRSRLRAQWRELFKTYDAVICPIMPTPAYPHDHSDDTRKPAASRSTARIIVYPDQLAWPGIATLPGLPSTAIPTGFVAGWIAGRRADRRPLAGRPHAAQAGRTDRARIRRLRAAADV